MLSKIILPLIAFTAITAYSQDNFTFTPEKPKAGDLITITYVPGSDLTGILELPDAVAYQAGSKSLATDVVLKRINRKLIGSIQTDTSANFVYFSFSVDNKFDNNHNKGYWIELYDGDKTKKGSNINKAVFYQYLGNYQSGIERNNVFAIDAYQKDFELYPEAKKSNLIDYLRVVATEKKDQATAIIQKEIESLLKDGLKEEDDYTLLTSLYNTARLPQQAKMISDILKEKYPDGKWMVNDAVNKFYQERDPVKDEAILTEIRTNIASKPGWNQLESNLTGFEQVLINRYAAKKDWPSVRKCLENTIINDKNQLASIYNNVAWAMQQDSIADLKYAELLSTKAIEYASANRNAADSGRPKSIGLKQWRKEASETYGMYADTYGMVQYKLGNYKKGLPYAKEAALIIGKGKSPDNNNTYALLAEKALPARKYKSQLEQFVVDGKSTSAIKEILKRNYLKEKKSENGYNDYIAALEKQAYTKMVVELKKSMLNDTAPHFALVNLDGKKTDINELKGKVVVVDFWATWCGPCVASFPGMQQAQQKYQDDPDVKFVFVNTWESSENKLKNAKDFLEKKNYAFDVWLDSEDKVVSQFKVDGIPTKFILDKDGKIRFKAVGFGGSDDKLVQELSAMIDMAKDPGQKAF